MTLASPTSIDVKLFVEVVRTGDEFTTFETDASGSVILFEHVERLSDGVVAWTTAAGDAFHAQCPACMSAEPCVQRVEVDPEGGVLVVHEHVGEN